MLYESETMRWDAVAWTIFVCYPHYVQFRHKISTWNIRQLDHDLYEYSIEDSYLPTLHVNTASILVGNMIVVPGGEITNQRREPTNWTETITPVIATWEEQG